MRAVEIELSASALFAAKGNNVVLSKPKNLRNVTPHHTTAERRRESRDQEPMVAASDGA